MLYHLDSARQCTDNVADGHCQLSNGCFYFKHETLGCSWMEKENPGVTLLPANKLSNTCIVSSHCYVNDFLRTVNYRVFIYAVVHFEHEIISLMTL